MLFAELLYKSFPVEIGLETRFVKNYRKEKKVYFAKIEADAY